MNSIQFNKKYFKPGELDINFGSIKSNSIQFNSIDSISDSNYLVIQHAIQLLEKLVNSTTSDLNRRS